MTSLGFYNPFLDPAVPVQCAGGQVINRRVLLRTTLYSTYKKPKPFETFRLFAAISVSVPVISIEAVSSLACLQTPA